MTSPSRRLEGKATLKTVAVNRLKDSFSLSETMFFGDVDILRSVTSFFVIKVCVLLENNKVDLRQFFSGFKRKHIFITTCT